MPQVTAAGQPDALAIFNAADTNANEPPDRTEGIIRAANTGRSRAPMAFTCTSCSRFAAEIRHARLDYRSHATGHKRMAPPLFYRPMRCRPPTPRRLSALGLNWGTAVTRQKIWRRPSLSAYVQTGARWLLEGGLPPVRLPSPVMHAASPMNGPTPRRTMTTWNIVRGVGVALASANDICACGDARMHHFPACRADRKLRGSVNRVAIRGDPVIELLIRSLAPRVIRPAAHSCQGHARQVRDS